MKLTPKESGRIGYNKAKPLIDKYYLSFQKKYQLNPTKCKYCNTILPYKKRKNKFCNHSCAASFNNLGVRRHGIFRKKKCLNCEKITKNSKYCSSACHKEFEWDKVKNRIQQTMIALTHSEGKKYILSIRGNCCEICEINTWNNKSIIMILDHINGNATDNSISNLRLICPNCDSQTNTYKGRNKGNGRHSRRQRYAEGKSY